MGYTVSNTVRRQKKRRNERHTKRNIAITFRQTWARFIAMLCPNLQNRFVMNRQNVGVVLHSLSLYISLSPSFLSLAQLQSVHMQVLVNEREHRTSCVSICCMVFYITTNILLLLHIKWIWICAWIFAWKSWNRNSFAALTQWTLKFRMRIYSFRQPKIRTIYVFCMFIRYSILFRAYTELNTIWN